MNSVPRVFPFRLKLAVGILAVATSVLIVICLMGYLTPLLKQLFQIFQGREQLRDYVESWGAAAPLAFITIQALQVVLAPIPGELTGAVGGFVFGAGPNIIYSTIGLTIGSTLAFLAARVVGLPLVEFFVPEHMLRKFAFLTERKGVLLALVLFTVPGFPKDILCYILGLSPIGFLQFMLVCTLGRIPGTILLSYSGSAVYNENWTLLIIMSALCVTLMGFCYIFRGKLDLWLKRRGKAVSEVPYR